MGTVGSGVTNQSGALGQTKLWGPSNYQKVTKESDSPRLAYTATGGPITPGAPGLRPPTLYGHDATDSWSE